jgi:hypothetical protein
MPTGSPLHKIHAKCAFEGLGDWLTYLLQAIGITAATYVAWKRRFLRFIGRPEAAEAAACGCGPRRDWLNEISWPIVRRVQIALATVKRQARIIRNWL